MNIVESTAVTQYPGASDGPPDKRFQAIPPSGELKTPTPEPK